MSVWFSAAQLLASPHTIELAGRCEVINWLNQMRGQGEVDHTMCWCGRGLMPWHDHQRLTVVRQQQRVLCSAYL